MFGIISMLQSLIKNYDQDMETLTKQQKQQVEKAEASQTVDLKNAAKRIKIEQVCPCKGHCILTLNAPFATKVVCFSHLLKCLRSLYGKQCGHRSDCSYRSSLFWVHAVCFYT